MTDRTLADVIAEANGETITADEIARAADEFSNAIVDENTLVLEKDGNRTEILTFDGDTARVVEKANLTAHQDFCKEVFNDPIDRKSEFRRIASFPQEALRLWGFVNHGLTDPAWYLKKEYLYLVVEAAHDRDMSDFRTMPGHYMRKPHRVII